MILCDFLILRKKVFVDENCNLITTNNDLETIVGIRTGKPRKLYRIIIVHFMLSFIVCLSFYKGLNWFTCIMEFSAYPWGQAKAKGKCPACKPEACKPESL